MKHILVIYEGAADVPLNELEGSTPLELARNVNASVLAARGFCGLLTWEQEEHPARLECTLASILGVLGSEARALRRGPVEAAATDLDPFSWTYAFRGNYVPTDGREVRECRVSGLSIDETSWLTEVIKSAPEFQHVNLAVVDSGRISVMFDKLDGEVDAGEFPFVGTPIGFDGDQTDGAKNNGRFQFMRQTAKILANQTLNDVRVDLGENPANLVWLWGGGPPVEISRSYINPPINAVMVTNSPLARGMAKLCGIPCRDLGNVWSELSKPELISASDLAKCVESHDFTVLYVEAPEEGGSFGSAVEKVKALDRLDIHVLGKVLESVQNNHGIKVMVVALPEDGMFMENTPVLISGNSAVSGTSSQWNEKMCAEGVLGRIAADRGLAKLFGE